LPGAILGLASEGVSGLIFTVEFVVAAADDEEDVARTGIGLAIGAAAFCGGDGGGGGGGGCDDDDAALLPDNAVAADFLPDDDDDDDDVEEAVCSLGSLASPWAELTCWIIIACRRNTCMHPSKMHAYTSPRSVAIRGLLCWESGGERARAVGWKLWGQHTGNHGGFAVCRLANDREQAMLLGRRRRRPRPRAAAGRWRQCLNSRWLDR